MVFSSTIFLFAFLPAVLAGYYLIRIELRNCFLLIMSLLFYAVGEPWFVRVMIGSIIVNYLSGLALGRIRRRNRFLRRIILLLAVVANLGILFYYKYFDFTVSSINRLFGVGLPLRGIVLPIGISFFTFQGMSYVFDVYLGKAEVQKNPLHVALYIALFPQLIAGPIVRYADVNQQIMERHENLEDFAAGVQRFSVGLAKKVVLSNTFAPLADQAFSTMTPSLGLAWLGVLAYAMQIYFDFSGYSDMAIGLGRMFGFRFLENFNYPYIACSVSDFWRRWHISLSSWFRDYVYIPLGGNRRGNVYLHLLAVFFLTGLWHGASWHFVAWGMWHGAFLIFERVLRNHHREIPAPKIVKWGYTMAVVIIGWVLFRAPGLRFAASYLLGMLGMWGMDGSAAIYLAQDYGVAFVLGTICMLPVLPKWRELQSRRNLLKSVSQWLEPIACGALLLLGIAYTVSGSYNPFIYFNF